MSSKVSSASSGDIFWDDLERDLEDPDFLRQYIVESIRAATIDGLVNALDSVRETAGISKADLARAIGAEPAVVRRLFGRGPVNPTLGTVAEIAAALGLRVTVEKLPASERRLVSDPLLKGRTPDAQALVTHLNSARSEREPVRAAAQPNGRGLRAKNSSPKVRTPA